MKKYFYTDGQSQFGPFTFDELKTYNIRTDTKVWYQGLPAWTPAGQVPKLQGLFAASQPPYGAPSSQQPGYGSNPSQPNYGAAQPGQQPNYGGSSQPNYGGGQPGQQQPNYGGGAGGYQQPQYNQQQPYQPQFGGVPPKTWLLESILVTIFCCLPFGIVGIINASNVESRFRNGDAAGAQRASDEAAKWVKVAFIIGIVGSIIWVIATIAQQ